ncbi:hypothetical protein BC941DRAFT_429985 [Chlamydoabsidia padenii]|nr:hypothetical protein BC941DRAFT_429985 [Chlamydoabsidia padenii]
MPPLQKIPYTNSLITPPNEQDAHQGTTLQLQRLNQEPSALKLLAAISNYKLAQLTFAPPDIHSLRKTAVIKNAIQHIYGGTPIEWLDGMTRWEFFTLESLDEIDMTQEDLETILSEYIRIMDSLKLTKVDSGQATSILSYQQMDQQQTQHAIETSTLGQQLANKNTLDSVHSTSCPTLVSPFYFTPPPPPPSSPPQSSMSRQDTTGSRKGFRLNQQRISWTCDTGLSSFAMASQHFAGELVNLFDMEFKVDITLDINSTPAPQLPQLTYITEKQQRRSSVDSFMCLIPAFESFQVDGHDGHSYVVKANKRTSSLSNSNNHLLSNRRISSSLSPARSSSLKYKAYQQQLLIPPALPAPISAPAPTSIADSSHFAANVSSKTDMQGRKPSLSKKKSIRKLVSMFGKKRLNPDIALPLDHRHESTLPTEVSSTTSFMDIDTTTSPYNAITTPFPAIPSPKVSVPTLPHTGVDVAPFLPTLPSPHRIITSNITPAEALTLYNFDGTLLSPLSSIATIPTSTTRAQRRRSKSVPELSSSISTQPNKMEKQPSGQLVRHGDLEWAGSNTSSRQMALHTTDRSSTLVGIANIEKKPSISMPKLNDGTLFNYPVAEPYHFPQQHHPYHYEMQQSHSAQELSRIGIIGNNGSVESVSSSLIESPITPKKQSSSFLQRMTSFARRKKPINDPGQHGIPSPVSV